MKRLMIMLALLPVGSFALPAYAAPGAPAGPPEFVSFCKADVQISTQFTVGDCVGFLNTAFSDAPGFVAQLCDFIRVGDPDAFYAAYDTYSECVRDGASELSF